MQLITPCITLESTGLWSSAPWWVSRDQGREGKDWRSKQVPLNPWVGLWPPGRGGWAQLGIGSAQTQWVSSRDSCTYQYLSCLCIFLKSFCICSLEAILKLRWHSSPEEKTRVQQLENAALDNSDEGMKARPGSAVCSHGLSSGWLELCPSQISDSFTFALVFLFWWV